MGQVERFVVVDLVRHRFLILTQGSVRGPAHQRESDLLQAPRILLRFGCLHQGLFSVPNLTQRPCRVSAYERRRIPAQGPYEGGDSLLKFQVPCGHAAVTQQACPARASERGPPKAILELLVCPYSQNLLNLQVRSRPGFLGELWPAAPRRLRLVVGTDLLAYVAPKGPVAHFRTELAGYLTPVLDGEVRDAEPGVHDAGGLYGAGGAPFHATRTASAGPLAGRIGVEVEVHYQVSYKEVRPDLVVYKAGVPPEKT